MLLTSFYTYKKPPKALPMGRAITSQDQMVPQIKVADKEVKKEQSAAPLGGPAKPADEPKETADQPDKRADQPDKPADEPDKPANQPDKPADQPGKPADQPDKLADQPGKPVDQPDKPADQPGKPADQPDKPANQPDKPADQPDKSVGEKEEKKVAKEAPPPAVPPRIPPRNQKPRTDVTDLAILVKKILSVSENVARVVSELKKHEGSYVRQGSVGTPIAESAPTSFDFYMKAMKPLQFGRLKGQGLIRIHVHSL